MSKGYSSSELGNFETGSKDNGGSAKLLMPKTHGERANVPSGARGSEVARVENGKSKEGGMVGRD